MPYPYPTFDQAFKCVELCQSLPDLKRDIVLFRYNPVTGEVFILTNNEIQLVIRRNYSRRGCNHSKICFAVICRSIPGRTGTTIINSVLRLKYFS